MGLFDFLKKKDTNDTPKAITPKNELFSSFSKYNEYIVLFMSMQQQGNYAPISAYEKASGEIVGFLYTLGEDNSYALSAKEVINRMESSFNHKLKNNDINSYVILYHSQFADDNNHELANNADELKAITVSYCFNESTVGKVALSYSFEEDELVYKGFKNFSPEENDNIFKTQLKGDYDYFQDREKIYPPVIENSIGLKIKKSNNFDLSNTWCGIFGFDSYREPNGSQVLMEYFALATTKGNITIHENITTSQLEYTDVSFKGISVNKDPKIILPVIKTDFALDVLNKEINEWENIENLGAIITGNGRDTFGISYFATDYAENREKYHSKKKHTIKISGIAFVLDSYNNDNSDTTIQYSEDFTMYMPNNDLPNYACFDFIGQLEDFKETSFLENNTQKGYLMNVRLITHPDDNHFFTIDMFVTPENMRFNELVKGMKITGMFQMQGQIAE
ncbi:hypothetical protein ACQY1Q_09320 [Tenacibaculum sp. TC6]|uniref:hypothetical protein n=1 Tax=Tenacibaculum sp. TC6 TaxID=3423223 RepID=UPI003D366BC3